MRITRLELHGFKSFADRTVLQFGAGISCVVGPNGCGKSNVVDALKWVIGEQSPKSLRGGEMADVIFAGSADRKPVGYAEVALGLTSEGGEPFPGDWARYAEVQVARRLYRSGVSEYLINQARVRRKDVVDLFMDTGVGNDLYSFIEQGRIDKIVGASTDEVRGLVDEAAGITRYKKRRDEAQSKLDATGTQLDRAADVAEEMGRRLKSLERQVLAAARFRRVRALLRQDEVLLALAKFQDLSSTGAVDHGALAEDRKRLEVQEGAWLADQDDLALREGELAVAQDRLERARDTLAEADAHLREAQTAAVLQAERASDLAEAVTRTAAEVEAEDSRTVDAEASLVAARIQAAALTARVAELQAGADAARAEEIAADAAFREAQTAHAEAAAASARFEADRSLLAARAEALTARASELPLRVAAAEQQLAQVDEQRTLATKRVTVADEAAADRNAKKAQVEAVKAGALEALEARSRTDLLARDAVRAAELALDAVQRELSDAVQRAETTAGQAEEEVAARVGRLEQQLDAELRAAERADQVRLAQLEATERQQLAAEEDARRRAHADRRKATDLELASWRAAAERNLEHDDAQRHAEVERTLAVQREAIEAQAAEGRARVKSDADAARDRRDGLERCLAEGSTALRDAEARQSVAVQRWRVAEGRLAVLQAEISARQGAGVGGEAVLAALGASLPLVQSLVLPEADRVWLAEALGERLWLPVVGADRVGVAAQAARAAGFARVVLDPSGNVERALGGARLVDTLEEAVAGYGQSGQAAVVRGTGERIEADGVVSLGARNDAEAALAAVREAESLAVSVSTLAEAAKAADGEVLAARARVEGLRIQARQAATELDAMEQHGLDTVEAQTAAAREALEQTSRLLRTERGEARQRARAQLEEEATARTVQRDADEVARREEAASSLHALRDASEGRVAALKAELQAGVDARREASTRKVEEGRVTAWTEVRASTADVAVQRERLKDEVVTARARLDAARTKADRSAKELAAARDALVAVERELADLGVVLARLDAEREAAGALVASLGDRSGSLTDEVEGLRASLAEVLQRTQQTASERSELDAAVVARRSSHEQQREIYEAASLRLDRARSARSDADADLAGARAELAGVVATQAGAAASLDQAGERRVALRSRLADAETRRAEAARLGAEAQSAAILAGTTRDAAAAEWEAVRTRVAALRDARDEVGKRVRVLEAEVGELRKRVLEAESRAQQAEQERTTLRTRIEERYQLDLVGLLDTLKARDAVVLAAGEEARAGLVLGDRIIEPVEDRVLSVEALVDVDTLKEAVERAADLRNQLARIGEVNLGALDEYTEIEARWSELDAQRGDLESSVQSIREAIATINRTCRERFVETFGLVDKAFRQSYPELVGGGEARLALTDGEDLLETGVEIFVRPPGKRLQSLSLLSGGEKAMTAIALLLALFSVKPSPFCVLDEVDAPLDEANGARFNEMLRKMAETTQFLVVTHNRKTMECADTLYGITMATPGCSALVSVRVD